MSYSLPAILVPLRMRNLENKVLGFFLIMLISTCVSFLLLLEQNKNCWLKLIQIYYLLALGVRCLKCVLMGLKWRDCQVCVQGFRGYSVPCLFQILQVTHIPWLMTIFYFQSLQCLVENFSCSVTLTPTFLLPSHRDLVVTLGPLKI